MKLKIFSLAVVMTVTSFIFACNDVAVNTNTNANSNANAATPVAEPTPAREMSRAKYTEKQAQEERERAKQNKETIGDTLDDAWIHTKIVAQLIANSTTPERNINVDVVSNMVTLRGTVDTAQARADAEKIAKETDGVKGVKNQIKVAPAAKATPKAPGKTKPNY
jgi:osmotically-inducible protein OsmY